MWLNGVLELNRNDMSSYPGLLVKTFHSSIFYTFLIKFKMMGGKGGATPVTGHQKLSGPRRWCCHLAMLLFFCDNDIASPLVCWQNGDVLVSAKGFHYLPFLWCKTRRRSFSAREGRYYFHQSCAASPSEILLFFIVASEAVMSSTTGSWLNWSFG